MKKIAIAFAASAMALTTAAPAQADPPPHAPAHGKRAKDRIYNDRGWYLEPRRVTRNSEIWQGKDGRYYCKRENGTTGLIIGAAGGALVGRAIDTDGDRTVGTLLGAALGGVLGREIDRGTARCR